MEEEILPIRLTGELLDELKTQDSSNGKPKYVYHGSPISPDKMNGKIHPHQASCLTGSEENTKDAIYAFANIENTIRYAIPIKPELRRDDEGNVLVNEENKPFRSLRTKADSASPQMIITYGEIDPNAVGYIYCLDAKNFTGPDSKKQFTCPQSQKIQAIYEVHYRDFPELFVFKNHPQTQEVHNSEQKVHDSFCDSLRVNVRPLTNTKSDRISNPDIELNR